MRFMDADVVIAGGGVIGCSVAYHAAKRGMSVAVVERGDVGSGTSGACDKAAVLQSKSPGPHLELAIRSLAMFRDLSRELETDIQYAPEGSMVLIETESQLQVMDYMMRRQRQVGLEVEMLPPAEVSRRLPVVSRNILGATWSRLDAGVNPLHLVRGLTAAAKRLGARFLTQSEVTGLLFEGDRVCGVQTPSSRICAKWVVNAAGAWAPVIAGMANVHVPILPRRGQLLVSERMPHVIQGDVLCARYITAKLGKAIGLAAEQHSGAEASLGVGLSLCQTREGNILLGSSREFVGYDTRNTYEVIASISKHAQRLVPGLQNVHFIRAFAGLRPYTPDGMPILGFVDGVSGLVMAAGHEGDGIALSPITGALIAELMDTGRTSVPIEPFLLSRFDTRAA